MSASNFFDNSPGHPRFLVFCSPFSLQSLACNPRPKIHSQKDEARLSVQVLALEQHSVKISWSRRPCLEFFVRHKSVAR